MSERPIANYAEETPWPAGSTPPDRAYHANRRPTAAEERDEMQSKMLSKYGQDAIESAAEHRAQHAADLAKFEEENRK